MEEYKPNSFRAKEGKEPEREKRVEPVISGKVRTAKKTGLSKVASIFLPKDINDVKTYVLMDVLVPMIKRGIIEGITMLLSGSSGKGGKGPADRVSYMRPYYDYNHQNEQGARVRQAQTGYMYDDIVFDSRGDAEEVLARMYEMIDSEYGNVSVADMYSLAGASTTGNYTANKYGWTDLSTARTVRTANGDGYILKLPRAIPLG